MLKQWAAELIAFSIIGILLFIIRILWFNSDKLGEDKTRNLEREADAKLRERQRQEDENN